MGNQQTVLRFLGTGDSMGVPRVYCSCAVCGEARTGGINRRLRSSILLEHGADKLLVDCGPDWRTQMEALGMRETGDILITHAHFDHIGGLPELADLCRWTSVSPHLYAPSEVLATINRQFPWIGRLIQMTEIDSGATLLGWKVTPFRVNHGKNGFSYAYRFEKEGEAWVYCPDSIDLQDEQKKYMRDLNLLILGTSFYQEEAAFHTRSVYDMVEATALLEELHPAAAWFTHMSHDVDLAQAYSLPSYLRLARTGETVYL